MEGFTGALSDLIFGSSGDEEPSESPGLAARRRLRYARQGNSIV